MRKNNGKPVIYGLRTLYNKRYQDRQKGILPPVELYSLDKALELSGL